ncbi:MAG: hypothetical protein ACFFD4_23050 [Candidatus Odinarchaeota archaeon]
MLFMNIYPNIGEPITSISGLFAPITRLGIKDVHSFREELEKNELLLTFVKDGMLIVPVSGSSDFNPNIKETILDHTTVTSYFETARVTYSLEDYSHWWDNKIPNLLYNAYVQAIKAKIPSIRTDFSSDRKIYTSAKSGVLIQCIRIGNSNFGFIFDFFDDSFSSLADPSMLPNSEERYRELEDRIDLLFNKQESSIFYLGGNKITISRNPWRID